MTQQKYSQAYAITPWKLVISYCEKLYACRSNIIIMCIIQERPLCVRMVSLFLWSYPFPWAPSVWFHMEKKVMYKYTLRSFFVGRRILLLVITFYCFYKLKIAIYVPITKVRILNHYSYFWFNIFHEFRIQFTILWENCWNPYTMYSTGSQGGNISVTTFTRRITNAEKVILRNNSWY